MKTRIKAFLLLALLALPLFGDAQGVANRWGLTDVRILPSWPDNGKTVTPEPDANDIEIAPLPGENIDYWAFPDLEIDQDNNLYLIFAKTDSHSGSGSPGRGAIMQKSTDAGQTWSTPVEVTDFDTEPIGGPTLGVTYTGRILNFNTDFANSQVLGERQPFFKWTDDNTNFTGFTSFEHLTTDYPDPGAVYGPGKAIRYEGVMLKPMYGRAASTGSRGIFIYRSDDDGESWTFHGTVIPDASSNDFEEPYIVEAPNKMLLAMIKSETLDVSGYSYSLDGGKRWSEFTTVNTSEGKNGVAYSPSGTALTVGRKFPNTDWRIIYNYSSTWGKTWSTEAYADSRTSQYMYAGAVWHPGINKFIVVYATDSNFPAGPCKIVIKYFVEQGSFEELGALLILLIVGTIRHRKKLGERYFGEFEVNSLKQAA